MPSRWASFFSSAALAALALLVWPQAARATLTIRSKQSTTANTPFFFTGFGNGTADNGSFMDPDPDFNFRKIDYGAGWLDANALSSGIEFEVESDKTALSNPTNAPLTVLVVRMFQTNGSTVQSFAPIAAVDDIRCDSSSACATLGLGLVSGESNQRYYGAVFTPGNKVKITVMPRDICTVFALNNSGTVASGCDSTSVVPGTTKTSIFVKFSLIAVPDALSAPINANPITSAPSLDDGPAITNLTFQVGKPTTNCTGLDDAENIYFPGDGVIRLQTGAFGIGIDNSGDANGDAVIIIGDKGTTYPSVYATDLTSQGVVNSQLVKGAHSVVQRVQFNSGVKGVPGFDNSANASDGNEYSLVFLIRDQAGQLGLPSNAVSPRECSIQGVRAAAIRGFLNESKCFIATAAFGEYEKGPVAMLRKFRDSVLLKSMPGRLFVDWYYDWSPEAAEWLMEHPAFRYPVLLALIPIQALAWLGLHPPILALLGLSACLLLGSLLYLRFSFPLRRE